MNSLVKIGAIAAVVVVVVVVGSQFLPGAANVGVPAATSTPQPSAVVPSASPSPSPSPSAAAGLPEGPFVVTSAEAPVQITVTIPSARWAHNPDFDAVMGDDDGLDPPETVGAWLGAWGYPAGTGFNVYGDPCHWTTTIPETPATTPDEIAAALAAQPSRDATTPTDVTVGGYTGKTITLHVPNDGADRATAFADCDQGEFVSWGIEGGAERDRWHQGPGQVDELWIRDVDGEIVVLDAVSGPATPADLVDELRTLAESATFE